jgi:hypothetical protein
VARSAWTLIVRAGPDVRREHFETLDAALEALGEHLDILGPTARRAEASVLRRRIEPSAQVAARIEIVAPSGSRGVTHAGIDLRGDGSAEAFTGRIRKQLVEQVRGESALDALRRALVARAD